MAAGRQLLPGFNHNVRHAGKLYHVQTEDSGTANPHVTTHLFLGGTVVASTRTSYGDEVGHVDLAQRVRKVMEAQHKEMLRRVVRGAFDEGASAPPVEAGPLAPDEPPAPPVEVEAGSETEVDADVDVDVAALDEALMAAASAVPPEAAVAAPRPPPPSAAVAPPPASAPPARRPASRNGAFDGWGPPMLSRASRPPPGPPPNAPAAAAARTDRRLDELILSYLAEDLGSKRDR